MLGNRHCGNLSLLPTWNPPSCSGACQLHPFCSATADFDQDIIIICVMCVGKHKTDLQGARLSFFLWAVCIWIVWDFSVADLLKCHLCWCRVWLCESHLGAVYTR